MQTTKQTDGKRYGVVTLGTKCACGFVLTTKERESQKRVAVPKCFDCYEEQQG